MLLPTRRAVTRTGIYLVLYGARGTGKTTLATRLARGKTVAIATESVDLIYRQNGAEIDIVDAPADPRKVLDYLAHLAKGTHDYDTLIFETVTGFDTAINVDIVRRHATGKSGEVRSVNAVAGGFGRAKGEVSDAHAQAAGYLHAAAKRGMRVIVVAHDKVESIDPPDGEPYTRWALDMVFRDHAGYYLREAELVARLSSSMTVAKDGKASDGRPGTLIDVRKSVANECKSRIEGFDTQLHWSDPKINPFGDILDRVEGIGLVAEDGAPRPRVWPAAIEERLTALIRAGETETIATRAVPHLLSTGFSREEIDELIASLTDAIQKEGA